MLRSPSRIVRDISLRCSCLSFLFYAASVSYPGLVKVAVASAAWTDGAGGRFQPSFRGFLGVGLLSWPPGFLSWLSGIAVCRSSVPLSSRPLARELPESRRTAPTARQRPRGGDSAPSPAAPGPLGGNTRQLIFPGLETALCGLDAKGRPGDLMTCLPEGLCALLCPSWVILQVAAALGGDAPPQTVLPLRWE